jgi:hypothetical protein
MTPEELDAIEMRAKAATEGPWETQRSEWNGRERCDGITARGGTLDIVKTDSGVYPPDFPDAEFIAHARSDVPALVEEVRQLRYDLSEARRWKATACHVVSGLPVDSERAIGHTVADAVMTLRRSLEKAEREARDLAGLRDVVARLQAANAALCERLGD